jgi:hypothetical protein
MGNMDPRDALDYLAPLGVDAISHRVLSLLPLVYVAWADGKMESVERERIEHLARGRYLLGAAGMAILSKWMEAPVPREFIKEGIARLRLLADGDPEPMVEAHELHELLTYAEWIARATAGAVDDPRSVTPEEETVLEELATAFRLDNGTSWARLLAELGPMSSPSPISKR